MSERLLGKMCASRNGVSAAVAGRYAVLARAWISAAVLALGCQPAPGDQPRPLAHETLATARLPPEGLNFLVVGDWGRGGRHHQREVAEQMGVAARQMGIDFVVSTGDNFYTRVESVHDPAWEQSFEGVYTAESLQVPWYITLGNHDYKGSVQAQVDHSEVSDRWRLPDRYYAVVTELEDRTCVQFLFLDTTPLMGSWRRRGKRLHRPDRQVDVQLRWLERTLSTSPCRWKIAAGHHPVLAAGSAHGRIRQMATRVGPLLEEYGVQAYFAGHEHDLQYLTGSDQVAYFISGAGSRTREVHHRERTVFAAGTSGFVAVSLAPERMRVFFIDSRGRVLYRTAIAP